MEDVMTAVDTAEFEARVRPHERELHAYCYRMLGSTHDADDVMQEVLVRAWRGLERFEGRSSVRTWLFRIATNRCLTHLARRPARVLPPDHGPSVGPRGAPGELLDDEPWLGPYPGRLVDDDRSGPEATVERLESLELAFVRVLHHLSPASRAVLVLRAVLDFSAAETAAMLGMTEVAVNSALQRARDHLSRQVPTPTQQATIRRLGEARVRDLVVRYARALESADLDAMLALLHEDATWCMPPMAGWYEGRDAIVGFLTQFAMRTRWRHVPTTANGQPAVGCYAWDDADQAYVALVLDVLTLDGDRIRSVTAFHEHRAVLACGLPARLPAGAGT